MAAAAAQPEVLLYYKYFTPPLDEAGTRRVLQWQTELAAELGLVGRVLVSHQGVNGNVAGKKRACACYIDAVEAYVLEGPEGAVGDMSRARPLFAGIQWKRSTCDPAGPLPFPKIRVRRVKEIVSSGGTLPWEDADPTHGGTHLKPKEFHAALSAAVPGDNLVILDVRNRWEHEVGHFTDAAGRAAIHPNMRNFTQFKEYIDTEGPKMLAGKKVYMYCTGGIRCETASAYLVKTGIAEEVCQLEGGIHTYCEEIAGVGVRRNAQQQGVEEGGAATKGDAIVALTKRAAAAADAAANLNSGFSEDGCGEDGNGNSLFLGSNFVFDRRATLPGGSHIVVGKCSECTTPYDQPRGDTVCTVCVCPVLVCESCSHHGVEVSVLSADEDSDVAVPFRRREWYCQAHAYLRGVYYNYLENFGHAELERQASAMHAALRDIQCDGGGPGGTGRKHGQTKKERARILKLQQDTEEKRSTPDKDDDASKRNPPLRHPNWRDTKLLARQIQRVKVRAKEVAGGAPVMSAGIRPPCRCCGKEACDGRCWGFWKSPAGGTSN